MSTNIRRTYVLKLSGAPYNVITVKFQDGILLRNTNLHTKTLIWVLETLHPYMLVFRVA